MRSLIWPIYIPAILTASAQTAILVLLPLYVLELGHSPAIAALVLGLRGLGQLMGDIPAGLAAGKLGDKACLMLGMAGYTLGYGLVAVSSDPILLGLGAMIAGCGMSFALIGRQAYVSARSASQERGRVMAMMAGAMRVGAFIGPLAGGLLASSAGYPVAFSVLVVVCLIALAVVAVCAEKGEPEPSHESHSISAIGAVLVEYRQEFLSAGVAMMALQFMRAARVALIPLAGSAMGLEVDTIGFVVAAGAAVDSLMFIPAGIIMDRWGRKAAAGPSLVLFATGIALLGWADSHAALLASAVLIGFANGLSSGLVMVLGADFAPEKGRSRFLGVWKLVADSGHAGAPMAISGLLGVASLLACSQVVAVCGMAGFWVMAKHMRETLVKHP